MKLTDIPYMEVDGATNKISKIDFRLMKNK